MTADATPRQQPDENPGGRQGTSRSRLVRELKDGENRLRKSVDRYELDPEEIGRDSLDQVREVIKGIYVVLRQDARVQDGVLAKQADANVWGSLEKGYSEVNRATEKLKPIFERFDELNSAAGYRSTAAELDDTTERMVDRKMEWLDKIIDFQRIFTAFYNEIARLEENPA